MVRGGSVRRAEAPAPRSDVSFRLDQKTANFKATIGSRRMQWSTSWTEEKKNESTCANRLSLHKNNDNNNNKGRQLRVVRRLYISVALQQKTANFKAAIGSGAMKWSLLTEEKKNESTCANRVSLHKNNDNKKGCGNYVKSFASTLASHCSKRRQTSRWP